MKEELGVEVVVKEVVYLEQFFQHSDQTDSLMIAYRCELVDKKADFTLEKSEVCEIGWYSPEEALKLELFPEYRKTLEIYFQKL